MRAESFAQARYPGRPFSHTAPVPLPVLLTPRLYVHWVTFRDEQLPGAFAVLLHDPMDTDPIFEIAELYAHGEARGTLWRYRSDSGWRYVARISGTGKRARRRLLEAESRADAVSEWVEAIAKGRALPSLCSPRAQVVSQA